MNSKGHLYISVIKSLIRLLSCAVGAITKDIQYLALGLMVAELLGIAEELVDWR